MIEIIYSFVCNGTVIGNYGYMGWLPFYDYGLYLIGLCLMFVVSAYFRSWNMARGFYSLFIGSVLSLIPIYIIWLLTDSSPSNILLMWIVITIMICIICVKGISDAENRERIQRE